MPTAAGMGQRGQKRDARLRKRRPRLGMSRCDDLPGSHRRKASRSLAVVSLPWTALAPQPLQRHLCVPATVLPLRFMGPPHVGHFIVFISTPASSDLFTGFIVPDLLKHLQADTLFVRLGKSIETTFWHEKGALTYVNAPHPDTLFVL